MNILVLIGAALIPMVVGFIWYNPKVFGTAWMNASGMTPEKAKGANMAVIFLLTFVFSFFLAFGMCSLSIHQFHLYSLFYKQPINDPSTEAGALFKTVMDTYGHSYRTFKHGAFHGILGGIVFALPIIAINAMFERRGFKYIAITAGFFIVCMALMGGVVCAFA
jgi:hypothetical protein